MKQKEPRAPLVKSLPISSPSVFLLINIMILQKFQNQWWTFENKMDCYQGFERFKHKKGLLKHYQFL
jgi:hypothetical protein